MPKESSFSDCDIREGYRERVRYAYRRSRMTYSHHYNTHCFQIQQRFYRDEI